MAESKIDSKANLLNFGMHSVFAVLFACVGFVINMAFEDIKDNRDRHNDIPTKYLTRNEYRDDHIQILSAVQSLTIKIEQSSSRLEADYNRRMDKLETNLTELIKKGN